MFKWLKSGAPWVWLTAGAVSISVLSVLGLLLLIGWNGLAYFWPAPLYQWETEQGEKLIGQVYSQEYVPISHFKEEVSRIPKKSIDSGLIKRISIKSANRDLYGSDFISLLDVELNEPTTPSDLLVIERTSDGDFYGRPVGYYSSVGSIDKNTQKALAVGLVKAKMLREDIDYLIKRDVQGLNSQLEKLRLEKRKHQFDKSLDADLMASYYAKSQTLREKLMQVEKVLDGLQRQLASQGVIVEEMKGQQVKIPLSQILDAWYPNQMNLPEKLLHWVKQVWKFLSDDPRESNSEGGVFPAMFGTVLLVLIMSVIVMPLGVIAAIYLHEYAKNNLVTRLIRVAVINLAGVPSIVYGVFGLGFFVYMVGGSIDTLFYPERLPAPTFGTPGLLWSALTLAILTLPVVIVATEEGLTRIPVSVRQGSLALGATQFETLWRIVLPMASPAILTGLILAVARAAGEVAPLMLVGAVKLASSLPVDDQFPFVHLERKFMHLGFHIYDVGFQTTNIESARPLVYATSFLLVTVIVGLNLTAISIRNNLREKYRTLGQD
ncbi:phosphate ABC transporter permease PstA [Vibrio caribbeanicus]|uniref:Phosphate transport system permease protein PstA n=1 Tax=Vibrio caribbeanicus ATCC BAA-2122 TaxID=796620 RepID=E3BMV4_9VIBR|nr:phosphate ABC transporter permease PstA [Vibrio caribbeanicus]EFP95580.1 ABC transporter transmembrane protein [Vibrio caribbeanicus ATCC BAA-2122]